MKARPTPQYLADTRRAWEEAARSGRDEQKRVLCDRASKIGYTYSGFVRLLDLGKRKRALTDKEILRMQEVEVYARKVFDLKMKSTYDGKNATYRRAYKSLLKFGQIPADVTEKMVYAAINRLNLANDSVAPHGKVKRKDALDCFEIDFTKSVYFHFNKKGEIFLLPNYQTKKAEQRLWISASVDVCTGVCYMEYAMATGENIDYVTEATLRAFERKDEVDLSTGEVCGFSTLLMGMPKQVYVDRGAGWRSHEIKRMLGKLNIKLILGANVRSKSGALTTISNKRGRGMVEKLIGDFKKDFETGLWHEHLNGSLPPDMTLGYLNDLLKEWCTARNKAPHPHFKTSTRWELFKDILDRAEYPPEDACHYGTAQDTATVIQRMIKPRDGNWYIAPSWANDGDRLEYVLKRKKCFVYHKNELLELMPQSVIREEAEEEFIESDLYEGIELRARFNDELKFFSAGEVVISSLVGDLEDDRREFLSKPRTPDEIRERARYFVMVKNNKKIIKMERVLQ